MIHIYHFIIKLLQWFVYPWLDKDRVFCAKIHFADHNIFLESSIDDIETAMWLLDKTPQLVFAISGKISNEFDDFATILLDFKDNRTVIISSNWIIPNHQRSCNIVSTKGKTSFDITKDETDTQNHNSDNARKVAEAAFLSSQKGIPIYLDLK